MEQFDTHFYYAQFLCKTADIETAKPYAIKFCQAQLFPKTIKKLENRNKLTKKTT